MIPLVLLKVIQTIYMGEIMAINLAKPLVLILSMLLVGAMVASSAVAYRYEKHFSAATENVGVLSHLEVWVDDDFNASTPGWGIDHFDTIQNGVDNVSDGGSVYVYDGVYDVFCVDGRMNLLLTAVDDEVPVVAGNQSAWDGTLEQPSLIKCVIFVNNSEMVTLHGFDVQGDGLSGRSYAVYYNGSTGLISNCVVSPNERGNMNSLGVRAHWDSTVTVENCTIENYGRIGIYCRTGTILYVYNNSIRGQIYTDNDGDYVSYGIEVEDLEYASSAVIRYNEIFNHDHTGSPTWSSAGIIVDAWRYYEVTTENCSAIIEYNDIHDNMLGLQIVPNDDILVHRNQICGNREYGAVSDPYWNGQTHVEYDLSAEENWWDDATGPYHPDENPDGLGDNITDNVVFEPWVETVLPEVELTKPLNGFLYMTLGSLIELKIPFFTNLIIGPIDIEAEALRCLYETDRVEFYIDDELQSTDTTEPYSWPWDDRQLFFLYLIKVVAYDTLGNSDSDEIPVWKLL